MGLACGCDIIADIWDTNIIQARKQHRCGECRALIEPGDLYYKTDALMEGDWIHHKMCEKCGDLSESMAAMGFCWILGELSEAHHEYLLDYSPPKIKAIDSDEPIA